MKTVTSTHYKFAERTTWEHVCRTLTGESGMCQGLKSTQKAKDRASGRCAVQTGHRCAGLSITLAFRAALGWALGSRSPFSLLMAAFSIHPSMPYKYGKKDNNLLGHFSHLRPTWARRHGHLTSEFLPWPGPLPHHPRQSASPPTTLTPPCQAL